MVAAPGKRTALLTVCVALVVIAVNTTAINTALPAIGAEFDSSPDALTWIVNAYVLAVAALVTVGGQLGDVFGKQRAFLAGIAVFAAGSAVVAAAPELEVVVLGRVLQGCGAAFLMPATISVISEVFPPEERGTAIGIWGAVGAISFAVGPLYGGFLTDVLDWRVVFIGDFLFLIVATYLGVTGLRGLSRGSGRRPDLRGAVVLSVGLFLVVFGVERAPDWGWGSPAFIATSLSGLALLGVFVRLELGASDPLVHLRLLRLRGYLGGNLATFANAIGLIGLLYFFNLYVQAHSTFDYSALRASLVLLPYGLTMFVFAFVGGRLADRIGYRIPVVSALLIAAIGFLLSSRFNVDTTEAQLWLPTVLAGVGIGITFSTSSAAGMVAVPDEEAGEAAGLINMFRYLGAVFVVTAGAALYGDPTNAEATVDGYAEASLLMAVSLIVIGLACVWLLAPRRSRAQ
jgi:DHA2 family methylenomycin A resistance protein-like MFS transporter